MIVVSDSTILIGLANIGQLDLLKQVFNKIYVPEEVFREVTERALNKPGAQIIRNTAWIKAKPVKDRTQVNLLMASLDKGESEVLALSKEMNAELILLDEEKARKSAVIAGFNVMGLLGMFVLAKKLGLLDEIKSLIEELRRKKFRISDGIIAQALMQAGEHF